MDIYNGAIESPATFIASENERIGAQIGKVWSLFRRGVITLGEYNARAIEIMSTNRDNDLDAIAADIVASQQPTYRPLIVVPPINHEVIL